MVGLDDVEILVQGIRGAAVPRFTDLLLGWHELHELTEFATQVTPSALDVLDERVGLVLRQHQDLADAGIHAVRQRKIDDPVFTAEGQGRFRATAGEVFQPFAAR